MNESLKRATMTNRVNDKVPPKIGAPSAKPKFADVGNRETDPLQPDSPPRVLKVTCRSDQIAINDVSERTRAISYLAGRSRFLPSSAIKTISPHDGLRVPRIRRVSAPLAVPAH